MEKGRCEVEKGIGLFGGTFDPIHKGHLELAELAGKRLALDAVYFIPAAVPPHKPDNRLTEFSHRENMIKLALRDREGMGVLDIERTLPVPSYTIDTLRALKNRGLKDEFYYLLGADAFYEIETWKSYYDLMQLTHFVVVARIGYDHRKFDTFAHKLGYRMIHDRWTNPLSQKCLFFLEDEVVQISSSELRRKVWTAEDLHEYLPEKVIQYIQENRLYLL